MLRTIFLATVVAAFLSTAARAETCNDDSPPLCCSAWTIPVFNAALIRTGAIVEDTYDRLQKSLESERRTDKMLCSYWRDNDSCFTSYGPAMCSGAATPAIRTILTHLNGKIFGADKKRLIQIELDKALEYATQQETKLGAMADYFRKLRSPPGLGKNPYSGIGNAAGEYGDALQDAMFKLRELRGRLDRLNTGFGFAFGGVNTFEFNSALVAIARANALSDRVEDLPWAPPLPASEQHAQHHPSPPRHGPDNSNNEQSPPINRTRANSVHLYCGGYVGTPGVYAWCRALGVDGIACGRPGDDTEINAQMDACGNEVGGDPAQALRTCCARFSLCIRAYSDTADLLALSCN